jgi:hypothetical protein
MRVHPGMQIVSPMVFCLTAGLTAPGVVEALAASSALAPRLPTLSTEPRSSLRPTTSPRALLSRAQSCPPRRGPPHNPERGSRSRCAIPVPVWQISARQPPRRRDMPRAETLVDVDHRQTFSKNGFRISAPEVRTPWTGPSSSALRSARRGRLTTRTAPHVPSTPFRLWLQRRSSSIRRAPRNVLIGQQRLAFCARTPEIS